MKISTVQLIYFSPTGTTKKNLAGIAGGFNPESIVHFNLTLPNVDAASIVNRENNMVVLGAPVYGGRIPAEAVKRFKKIKGEGLPAVVVVVYGNRAYDNALFELKSIAQEIGYIPIAGGAFIGEHSFTSEESPIAVGRPDEQDIQKAMAFGASVRKQLEAIESLDELPPLEVPGEMPPPIEGSTAKWEEYAETVEDLCDACGICADACPTGAITVTETAVTDATQCIRCCACVKICPTDARIFNSPRIKTVAKWLSENCSRRAEPEVFL